MHGRLQRLLGPLSLGTKLASMVAIFVAIVACMVVLTLTQMEVLSGVRAYVGGESQWSKGQKDAVQALRRYADTRDPSAYARYLQGLAVPLGDRKARLELDRPNPDPRVVAAGFVAGGNHPDDVSTMARFYRRFHRVSYMAISVGIWKLGDRYIEKLRRQGEALHAELSAARPSPRRLRTILARVDILNERMTPLEQSFSRSLGEGARWIKMVLLRVTWVTSAALLMIGLLFSWVMGRHLQAEEEARVFGALADVGRELIGSLETPVLLERLCQITTKGLGCEASSTLLWDAREDAFVAVAAHAVERGDAASQRHLPREMVSSLFYGPGGGDVAALHAGPGGRRTGERLAMALRHRNEIVGVQLATRRPGRPAFTASEHRIAEGIAYVASMALANARAVQEMERVSRLKSEFLSTMSHELRTPLNVMLGYAEMARDPDLQREDREQCVGEIERAGRDLLEMIESALEIGRIDDGHDEVQLEPVDLPALWATVGDSCARLPRHPEVTLEWPRDVPQTTLVTDVRKLTAIVRNLVGNALKFTERGRVRAEAWTERGSVVVKITDTGIGIDPADHESIFEMFRQADGSDSRRFGGAGLGLYIVRRFVRQLGGVIALESAPRRGSAFTVVLPNRVPGASQAA